MNYRPRSFLLQELVPPEVFEARGERAWELLNPLALMSLQSVRDKFGPIVVNNWHAGGAYKESGLRAFDTSTGAAYSMHKFGAAYDCKSSTATPTGMFEYIITHREEFPYVTVLEDVQYTPTWLHIDCRNHNKPGIWIVKP